MNRKGRNLGDILARILKVLNIKTKLLLIILMVSEKAIGIRQQRDIYLTAMTSYGIKLRECISNYDYHL